MIDRIRQLVMVHGRLPVPITKLNNTDNLWACGLASFAAVQLMMALEEAFEIEFDAPARSLLDSINVIALNVSALAYTRTQNHTPASDRQYQEADREKLL